MRQKLFYGVLGLEALLCVLFCLARVSAGELFASAAAFPFAELGAALRALAMSGTAGRAVSTALYLLLCALPLLFVLPGRRKLYAEDVLPVLMSLVMLAVMYLTMNPTKLETLLHDRVVGSAILGLTVYSLLLAYGILRLLRSINSCGEGRFMLYIRAILWVTAAMFVLSAFGAEFADLTRAFAELESGNTDKAYGLAPSYVFIALRYIASVLPELMNVVSVALVLKLADAAAEDRYSADTREAARRLGRWCTLALAVVAVVEAGVNLAQLLFVGSLRVVDCHVTLPIGAVLFVLAALLFARLVEENSRLKSDNDMFI